MRSFTGLQALQRQLSTPWHTSPGAITVTFLYRLILSDYTSDLTSVDQGTATANPKFQLQGDFCHFKFGISARRSVECSLPCFPLNLVLWTHYSSIIYHMPSSGLHPYSLPRLKLRLPSVDGGWVELLLLPVPVQSAHARVQFRTDKLKMHSDLSAEPNFLTTTALTDQELLSGRLCLPPTSRES